MPGVGCDDSSLLGVLALPDCLGLTSKTGLTMVYQHTRSDHFPRTNTTPGINNNSQHTSFCCSGVTEVSADADGCVCWVVVVEVKMQTSDYRAKYFHTCNSDVTQATARVGWEL